MPTCPSISTSTVNTVFSPFEFSQSRGRYVNHVVIQENPVIMQDTDKTVRVECAFTAEDQTVSFRPTASDIDGRGEDASGGGISVTVPFQVRSVLVINWLCHQIWLHKF